MKNTQQNIVIDVARDFSAQPYGRYKQDGEYSAENFRKDHLVPALNADKPFTVDLSGSNRYGSSFLEEAFGGLVREGITSEKLNLMTVQHDLLPSIVDEIHLYIQEALSEKDN